MTKLWLRFPAKVREQATRAVRLFGVAEVAQLAPVINGSEKVSWALICSTTVAAVEVVFRQFVPVTPAASLPTAQNFNYNAGVATPVIVTGPVKGGVTPLGAQPPTDGTAPVAPTPPTP